MSTRNYDASFITQKRRAIALNTFKNTVEAGVAAGTTIRKEQVSGQLQETIADRKLASAFTNPTDSCPCTDPANAPNPVTSK